MKTNEEIKEWFDQLYDDMQKSLFSKKDIIWINSFTAIDSCIGAQNIKSDQISDANIILFYEFTNGLKITWETKEKKKITFKAEGTFNLLPLEEVLTDNWDDSWADTWAGTEEAEAMVGFRPLDMFYESAGSVGFYVNRTDKTGLYLYKEEGVPEPLHIDLEAYLKLLAMSKGYGWWQNALVEISTGVHQPNTDSFRENMPKIFPEFNWDEFVALYESLRIDKQ